MFKKCTLVIALLLSVLFLNGCSKEVADNGKPIVYTSFYPIKDLVQTVAGDTLNVKSFIPAGKDPHLWDPSPKNIKELAKAKLLVVNGANMERWLDSVRKTLPDLNVLVLGNSVNLITYKGAAAIGDFAYAAKYDAKAGEKYKIDFGHTHEDILRVCFINNKKNLSHDEIVKIGKKAMEDKGELIHQHQEFEVKDQQVYSIEMGHESGDVYYKVPEDGNWVFIADRVSEPILSYDLLYENGDIIKPEVVLSGSTSGLDKITYDPHSWLSLQNAKSYVNAIQDELIRLFPENERTYKKNKVATIEKLTNLKIKYEDLFSKCDKKEFVVTHHAFEYLCREFGLKQFPLQGLVSTETPSLKTIKKALDVCEYYGIKTVFYEHGLETKGAEVLAEDLGGKVESLTSMEYSGEFKEGEPVHYIDIMAENLEKIYQSLKR